MCLSDGLPFFHDDTEYLISIASTPLKVYHLQEVKPQIEGVYGSTLSVQPWL